MINLNSRDSQPLYLQICLDYENQITAGILQKGERLPSVRELAMELSINPNTIQRAYRELEARGYIETIPGKGCFVKEQPSPSQALWQEFDQVCSHMLRQGITTQQMLEHLIERGKHHAQTQ